MINASKEFKEKLKKGARLVNYADITLSDGEVLHLTYKDFMIGGCQIEDKATDGKFGVGYAIGKSLDIKLENNDERFSRYDFYKSTINLYVAMALDDGTIEKIRKGVFYTVVPETPGDIIEISAVDGMYKLDKDYSSSTTAYPATLQNIISGACLDCGIPIGFTQFDNMNFIVQEKPEKATYRQVVSWACQIAGYNARIDNNGYMQLIWYNSALLEQYNYVGGNFKTYPHDTVINGGNFTDYSADTIISGGTFTDVMPEHIFRTKTLSVATDDVQITGVRVICEDEKKALFGEEGYVIELNGNPFANGKEQAVANYLGNRITGMIFRPFSAEILENPLYEPFEVVRVSDLKGNVYNSVINSISYKIGNYTQISCEAEDPVRSGSVYYSEAAAAVVEARRNAEKQLTAYDKAVQQMNQLAGNAMGFHTTYEEQPDGSRITYLHDKPTLEESKTIYKQAIDGFFISTDGGKTYTAGFDKNGNAVVNILYAIGIVADWIRGGTLTLGGDNNISGSCVIYDALGNEIGRFDKDGIVTNSANITGGYINIYTNDEENSRIILQGKTSDTLYSLSLYPQQMTIRGGGFLCDFSYSGVFFDSLHYYKKIKTKIGNTEIESGSITILQGSSESVKLGSSISKINGWNFSSSLNNSGKVSLGDTQCVMESLVRIGKTTGSRVTFFEDGSVTFFGTSRIMATDRSLYVKSLTVNGTKSRLAKTQNYSDRLLYCYETPKPYFGDIGEGILDEEGICYIFVDDIFYETISTECQYQVFLQKYGQGDAWVEERKTNYFLIKGTPHLKFGWELKARQLGYETERLENPIQEEPKKTIDYEAEAQNYIENYYKEVMNYEEGN